MSFISCKDLGLNCSFGDLTVRNIIISGELVMSNQNVIVDSSDNLVIDLSENPTNYLCVDKIESLDKTVILTLDENVFDVSANTTNIIGNNLNINSENIAINHNVIVNNNSSINMNNIGSINLGQCNTNLSIRSRIKYCFTSTRWFNRFIF